MFDEKLKEFKLDGTIGGAPLPGGKEKRLTYTSLEYQVMNALTQGYREEVVCAAVVRVISPDNELRAYFEGRKSLTVDFMLEGLRGHFEESESATVLADLGKAKQKSSQTAYSFLVSVFVLRDRVMKLSEEEKAPQDEKFVYNRVKHAIETGVRNHNIRTELREVLSRKHWVTDDELLKTAKEAMAREKARIGKFCAEARGSSSDAEDVEVAALHVRSPSSSQTPTQNNNNNINNKNKSKKEPNFQVQVNELKASQEALQASVLKLTTAMENMNNAGNNRRNDNQGRDNDNYDNQRRNNDNYDNQRRDNNDNYNNQRRNGNDNYDNWRGNDNNNFDNQRRGNNDNSDRNQRQNDGNRGQNRQQNRRNPGRCQQCVNNNSKCNHCFRCGGRNHQMSDCHLNH